MSRSQRDKGKSGEREIVNLAREHGLSAERTWHLADSPQRSERCCDVEIAGRPYQVKRRGRAWADLYAALEHVRGAFIRRDGSEWLVVMPAEDYLSALTGAKPARAASLNPNTFEDVA